MSAATNIGSGRFRPRHKTVALDHQTSEGWVEIARYGDPAAASAALDEAIAENGHPAEFRLRGSTAGRLSARIGLVVLGVAALALAFIWIAILR